MFSAELSSESPFLCSATEVGVHVLDRTITRVAVIDDVAEARAAMGWAVVDAGMEALPAEGPLNDIGSAAVDRLLSSVDAVVCDHHLAYGDYAAFSGAELVAFCYSRGLPAILSTQWEKAEIEMIRTHRAHIPVLVNPSFIAEPDHLIRALLSCVQELSGAYASSRRPWRTLVRVVDVRPSSGVVVEVPAWQGDEMIYLPTEAVPPYVGEAEVDRRFHARVNIGAARSEELFFLDWEDA